jgi:hypothetical protein
MSPLVLDKPCVKGFTNWMDDWQIGTPWHIPVPQMDQERPKSCDTSHVTPERNGIPLESLRIVTAWIELDQILIKSDSI